MRDMLAAATEREAEKNAAAREALRASQINALRQHLRLRDDACQAFVEAQTAAIAAWRDLVKHSEAAKAACPVGGAWPSNSLCVFGDLKAVTELELYRVGAGLNAVNQNRFGFPGGHVSDFSLAGRPGDIPPMVETVRAASARVLARLTGKDDAP